MQPREKRTWDQYSRQQEISQNPYGTEAKAKLSGKQAGELYQRDLRENQRIQSQEQRKNDQQSSNKLPSQELSEELRGILQTRKKILEISLSPQELSKIGNGIFQSELHSNDDKLRNLYKEIKCHLDEEREYYNALTIEEDNVKNEIRQLKIEKKFADLPKEHLKSLAKACRDYSASQGAVLNDLQQQIDIAEKFASLGFNNSVVIENLKSMQEETTRSRSHIIKEGQDNIEKWKKNEELIEKIENDLKEARKLEIELIHPLRNSQRNMRIYANLATSLEAIPNSNLQPEIQSDMILETDNPQSIEEIVKEHMLKKIKEMYKNTYLSVWNRVEDKTGKEPFFQWHRKLNLYAYEEKRQVNGKIVKQQIYITHNPNNLASQFHFSSSKLYGLENGESYKGITRISLDNVIDPSKAIYDITYKFTEPYEFIGNPSDKKGVYFTDSIIDTYIDVKGKEGINRKEINCKLNALYNRSKRHKKYYYLINDVDGFVRCNELEKSAEEE